MILMDCNNAILGNILYIVKNILNLIWIISPILAIISLTYHFTMIIKNPDDKKLPNKIKNSILALLILFMIPTIVNTFMYLLDDEFIIKACWTQNISKPNYNAGYINPNPRDRKPIFTNPDDYESGKQNSNNNSNSSNNTSDTSDTSCGDLEYCNKFLTSMVNNSKKLNEAIINNNARVTYSYENSPKTWAAAIKTAERGGVVRTTCVIPANLGITDIVGSHKVIYSSGTGGFHNYKGKITQYTKQYKFDGSMSFKTAIQKGIIHPGDIIGVKGHTFAIYSVNQNKGTAVVFDGGHRYTNKCQKSRKCSPMFVYSASSNSSMRLYQIIRWVK